jgi:hypothetical protein
MNCFRWGHAGGLSIVGVVRKDLTAERCRMSWVCTCGPSGNDGHDKYLTKGEARLHLHRSLVFKTVYTSYSRANMWLAS